MCEGCEKYGTNGEYWYFNPENYARRIYKWRKTESEAVRAGENPSAEGGDASMIGNMGAMKAAAIDMKVLDPEQYTQKVESEGMTFRGLAQVITLEEVQKIMDICWPITAMTCACRRQTKAIKDEENFTCMGMGPGMYKWERWPQIYRGGVQYLTPDEARGFLDKLNRLGLVHIAETHGAPYTGGICNCEMPLCGQLRARLEHDVPYVVLKGHYVAQIEPEACTGCLDCMKRCHFDALHIHSGNRKVVVDAFKCFGCGNCRRPCRKDAITMVERTTIPAVKDMW
jgi:Pyruvate/2-oxoacid:ferredoxin oxidoreductase delta subunit